MCSLSHPLHFLFLRVPKCFIDFIKRVAFFGMRNRLQEKLQALDQNTCAIERLQLADFILKEELDHRLPWTLKLWKADANRLHRLNQLSLIYHSLRHMPHVCVLLPSEGQDKE